MVGERAGRAVGNSGAGKNSATGRKIGQSEVRKGAGSGDFRQDSGSLWTEETAGDWRWKGGGDDGDSGAEPPAFAGHARFGVVLGKNVPGLAAGVTTEISEA